MKEKEKRMILLIIVIGIIIVSIIHFVVNPKGKGVAKEDVAQQNQEQQDTVGEGEKYVQTLEDGTKLNTSTKLNETKQVNGLEIGNIQLTMTGGQTKLIADVKNNTGKDVGVTAIDITLYNESGSELVTIGGVIGNVKAGETVKLEASTTLDFANAYDFKVTIK